MSSFTWLDYSERERRKMLEVVDLFKERDTRDELGLGAVRDSFADQFFPGTSTIMTRARYFLIVPWTYRRLENKQIESAQIADRARRAETELIEAIARSTDKEGNIGKFAKTTLKRLPSSVYWQGLGIWGIRAYAGSQAQYHRSLDRYYTLANRHGRRLGERDVEHDDLIASNWHGGLVEPSKGFPEKCSLRLSRREAEYLSERIRLSPICSGSLLAELVAHRKRHDPIDFCWQHPHLAALPSVLQEKILHAQNFSEIMHGAALIYNLILAEENQWADGIRKYRTCFSDWIQMLTARSRPLSEWRQERFWAIAHLGNPRIRRGAHDFVNAWWNLVLSGDPKRLRDSAAARKLITDREKKLKGSLARIGNPRAQEIWNGDSGASQLEYRWQISQSILRDIFQGLEVRDA